MGTYPHGPEHRGEARKVGDAVAERADRGFEVGERCLQGGDAVCVTGPRRRHGGGVVPVVALSPRGLWSARTGASALACPRLEAQRGSRGASSRGMLRLLLRRCVVEWGGGRRRPAGGLQRGTPLS